MADAIDKLKKNMALNLHHTLERVLGQCPHGIHDVGTQDEKNFATCEELADHLLPIIPEVPEGFVYVNITDLITGKYLGTADSFDGGEHFAWGYLHGIGAKVNDGQQLLVYAKSTGAYSIVIAGGILERGEDWEYTVLEEKRKAALKAAEDAQRALDEHVIARMAKEDAVRMDTEEDTRG